MGAVELRVLTPCSTLWSPSNLIIGGYYFMGCWGRGGTVPAMWEKKPQEKRGLQRGHCGGRPELRFLDRGPLLADGLGAEETDLVCELALKRPDCGQCRYTAPIGKRVVLFLAVKKDSGSCTEIRLKQHFRPVRVFPAVLGESSGASCKAASGLQLRRGSVTGAVHCQLLGSALAASCCPGPCRCTLEGPLPPHGSLSGLVLHHSPDEHSPKSWSSSPEVSFPGA